MVAVVDYGLGNAGSVKNMLESAGVDAAIASAPERLREASGLILPGVGHFDAGIASLRARGLVEVLRERVLDERIPILGICLGAQMLGRGSEEGNEAGLGWLPMETVAFDRARISLSGAKVPHMGWRVTDCPGDGLFAGLGGEPRFYYVHSFHFRCDDPSLVICTAEHGYRFAAGVGRENVFGVQFHPEKSHVFGRQLLKNFAALCRG